MKTCIHCGEQKELTEFYSHPDAADRHQPYCKTCAGKVRAKNQKTSLGTRSRPGRDGEALLIDYLRERGIYAAPGKASEWTWLDVVAWGCVRLEVKYAFSTAGKFKFSFSERQQRLGTTFDVLVLICDDGVTPSYHFFRSDDAAVISSLENRRFGYTRNAKWRVKSTRSAIFSSGDMIDAEGRYDMIEAYRNDWSNRLAALKSVAS